MSHSPFQILLVEDNPGDAELVREGLAELGDAVALHIAWDGEDALDFMRREGSFTDAPRPDLVIMDINLPGKNGLEVLALVRADSSFTGLPVVMFSTSAAPRDIEESYRLGANSYVVKPIDLDPFLNAVQTVARYWIDVARLPRRVK